MAFQILALLSEISYLYHKSTQNSGTEFRANTFYPLYGQTSMLYAGCKLTKKTDWGYSQRRIAKLTETGFMAKKHNAEKNCNFLESTAKVEVLLEACHGTIASWDKIKTENCSEEGIQTLILLQKKSCR